MEPVPEVHFAPPINVDEAATRGPEPIARLVIDLFPNNNVAAAIQSSRPVSADEVVRMCGWATHSLIEAMIKQRKPQIALPNPGQVFSRVG